MCCLIDGVAQGGGDGPAYRKTVGRGRRAPD
jgi:hypothetical protein